MIPKTTYRYVKSKKMEGIGFAIKKVCGEAECIDKTVKTAVHQSLSRKMIAKSCKSTGKIHNGVKTHKQLQKGLICIK